MIWNYLNLKNKGRENKANRASLPYKDAVHPGNRSEDVRHNEECRFFLHNNNLQSRGKTHKFQNHYLTLAKRLKFTTPDNQILQKCARRARKMTQWVKVLTTKPDRTHMLEEEKQVSQVVLWPLHASYEGIHNKYFKIPFILFVHCAHMYILYMDRCLPRSEEREGQWML